MDGIDLSIASGFDRLRAYRRIGIRECIDLHVKVAYEIGDILNRRTGSGVELSIGEPGCFLYEADGKEILRLSEEDVLWVMDWDLGELSPDMSSRSRVRVWGKIIETLVTSLKGD